MIFRYSNIPHPLCDSSTQGISRLTFSKWYLERGVGDYGKLSNSCSTGWGNENISLWGCTPVPWHNPLSIISSWA